MLTITITCLKCTIGIIAVLIGAVAWIYFKKTRKEINEAKKAARKKEIEDSYIDWGIDVS